jgi:hypothetical protein
MTIICPDKSLKEWKRLVSDIGEAEAYLSFFRASNRIPFTAEAEKLLGMKRDVVPVDTKLAGVEVVAPPSGKRPKQMFVRIVGDDQDMYPVASFAEASKKFSQARDATFKLGPGAEVPKVEVLDQDGKLVGTFSQNGKIWSGGKVIYDPAPTQIAAPAVKPAASAPVSAPKSPLQIINASKAVKLSVPEGTTMIRGTDSKGRKSVQPLGNFKTYNPFQGADIVKIEAGRIGLQKQFIPMDEPVKVGERVKQGDITEAIEPSTASAPITAQSVEQLRAALPTSGLSPEQQSLISAFLDSPLSAALEGVRFKLADALEKGWQGSYFDGLVEIARNSDPATAPHEFAPRVWELLPEEVRQQFEAMRVAEINSRLSKPMNATLIQQLEKLRDNPTSGGEQFIQGGYDRSLYHLSSPEEFFTHSFSDKFTGENLNPEQKTIWGQIRDLFRSIIAAIKKFFKLPQSQDELLTNIMAGRYEVTPESGAVTEAPQASLPAAEEPKREIHQIGGRQWFTEYPEALTAADYAKGREKLVNFVQNELFLPGFEHEKNIFVFKPDGETHEAEGRVTANPTQR